MLTEQGNWYSAGLSMHDWATSDTNLLINRVFCWVKPSGPAAIGQSRNGGEPGSVIPAAKLHSVWRRTQASSTSSACACACAAHFKSNRSGYWERASRFGKV